MTNKFFLCLSLVIAGGLLTACDSVRNTFGLDHYQADEMQVSPNPRLAALTIPPNFQLRPPRPGEPNPHQASAEVTAKGVLLGDNGKNLKQEAKQKGASDAEANLLNAAALQADTDDIKDIRNTVDAEAPEVKKNS